MKAFKQLSLVVIFKLVSKGVIKRILCTYSISSQRLNQNELIEWRVNFRVLVRYVCLILLHINEVNWCNKERAVINFLSIEREGSIQTSILHLQSSYSALYHLKMLLGQFSPFIASAMFRLLTDRQASALDSSWHNHTGIISWTWIDKPLSNFLSLYISGWTI